MHLIDEKLYRRVLRALHDGADAMESSNAKRRDRRHRRPLYFAPSRISSIRRAAIELARLNAGGDAEQVRRDLVAAGDGA